MPDPRPTIDELMVGDEPAAWASAGFSVEDDTCRVGSVRVRLVGREREDGVLGWTLRAIDPPDDQAIDGLSTTASSQPPSEPAVHPNGVTRLDHVVLASSDGERTAAALTDATGLDIRRIRETSIGGTPGRQWFFRLGEVILELVAPDDGDGSTPTGFFGLAMIVDDIDSLPAFYGDAISGPRPAVQEGRRIATLRHRQFDISVPIAFMSPDLRHP